tara:strand:+ start:537 stop:2963 length:2427 start_codon:yes stop_codon:yes gene_type:complete
MKIYIALMNKILIIPFFILSFLQVIGQTHPCGFTNTMNDRYAEEPFLLEMRAAYEIEIQQIINSKSSFAQKTIPVVIHVIYNDSYSNISSSQVASAITAINEDFNAGNSDFSSVISAFSGVKSNLNINFELANLDPSGNATSGITRTQSDFTDSAGENVKFLVNWDSDMYLNIWVVDNIESGAGAYAYYPGTAPNGNEGIVCRHSQFGTSGTSSSSNFSATTLTHEIGHYLNLAHTWGNSNDAELEANCNEDDGVSDTPNTAGTLYGCNTNQSTCGSLDNVQNYMDYTECTNMFTTGQRSRVHAALHSSQGGRVNLWQYENLIATGLVDDSSCDEELITVQIHTGTYANEVSWVILTQGGDGVAGGGGTYSDNSDYYTSVCLEQGSYTFESIDSYGDGWNGGYYNVRNCDNVIIANNSNPTGNGASESFIVADCGSVPGCTNPDATNYNPLASEDDGTCLLPGCTNYNAENYNPDANEDDGTCILNGCTDATAINYNSLATIDDDTCEYVEVPSLFNYELTGGNHTVVLPEEMSFNLLNTPLANFDVVGVFYDDINGTEHCAGYAIWQGTTNSIAVQGDDATTEEIDGLVEGGTFKIKVWDQSEDLFLDCIVHYLASMPNQAEYTTNGISAITDGSAIPPVTSQLIELPLGWSLFSTYLVLENMDVEVALSSVFENIVIVKDFQGNAYLADWGFNGIGDLVHGDGYQIKMMLGSTLELSGDYYAPEEVQITLPLGWSIFGYLRTQAADCIAVIQSISNEVVIVKNSSGAAYLPSWDFNGIGNLKPGEGYQIKMNSTQILEFNSNLENY